MLLSQHKWRNAETSSVTAECSPLIFQLFLIFDWLFPLNLNYIRFIGISDQSFCEFLDFISKLYIRGGG